MQGCRTILDIQLVLPVYTFIYFFFFFAKQKFNFFYMQNIAWRFLTSCSDMEFNEQLQNYLELCSFNISTFNRLIDVFMFTQEYQYYCT